MFGKNRSIVKKAGTVISPLIVIAVLLFGNVAVIFAAPAAQDDTPFEQRLENAYARVQLALETQAMRLDHAVDLSGNLQEWIDLMTGQGHDVADIVAAKAAFDAGIAEAQGCHAEAAAILAAHAGFDDEGSVTDPELAVEMLRGAGDSLRCARRTLIDAGIDLRRAITDWRIAQRSGE
jgi:hypothetical protein